MSETRNGKSDFGIFIEKKVKSQSPGSVKLDLIQKSWICEKCQRPEIASPILGSYQKIQTHEKCKSLRDSKLDFEVLQQPCEV